MKIPARVFMKPQGKVTCMRTHNESEMSFASFVFVVAAAGKGSRLAEHKTELSRERALRRARRKTKQQQQVNHGSTQMLNVSRAFSC